MRVYFPTPARRAGPKMQTIPSDFISEGTFFIWAAPHNSSSAFAGYFLPIHRFGKFGVHKVRLHFPNLGSTKNLAALCAAPLLSVKAAWELADILNACMALPNLTALLLLWRQVVEGSRRPAGKT